MTTAGPNDNPPSSANAIALDTGTRDGAARAYALQIITAGGLRTVALMPGCVVRVGRNADADVVVDGSSASSEHAAIYAGDPPEVEDLHSDAGTRVQGARIAPGKRIPLPAGTMIQIAATLFHVRQTAGAPPAPTPAPAKSRTPAVPGAKRPALVRDAKMIELYRLADRVAASNLAVLVLGETGVGKQLVAERIHAGSPRRDRPFSRINCAALAEGVLASELFGHERGAFTGAHATKIGLFEAAHTGTVFLDEIGELPLDAQAKLLRVLEAGEVIRVGSHTTRQVDVRVVSATNRDLRQSVKSGSFRADLFFRLNGLSLVVPPLRERPLDVVPLAEYFADAYATVMGNAPPQFSEDAKEALARYQWPGNVRELKNVVERAVVMSPDAVLDAHALSFDFSPLSSRWPTHASSANGEAKGASEDAGPTVARKVTEGNLRDDLSPARRAEELRAQLERAERDRIVEALERAGNQVAAARLLGLSRRALIYRLDLYDIGRPRKGRA
ncbi:MAG TPA: sigma 54-interacting transcriptional regulator [Polyangiaceae bacterium]